MERHSPNPKRVDRHRDRDRQRHAPYGKPDFIGSRPGGKREPPYHRIFINNVPYEEKWQDIKDLFREKVGEVTYVELVTDNMGKSRGYGIIEFKTKELMKDAVEKMKGHEIRKRKIIVREDPFGDILSKALMRDGIQPPGGRGGRMPPGPAPMPPPMPLPGMPPPMPGRMPPPPQSGPPPDFRRSEPPSGMGDVRGNILQEIGSTGPIGNTVFVANLDYRVTYAKVKEVFKLAGNVVKVDLHLDKDNKSRGMATVTFETTMEAVQAISMLNKQLLYDRQMLVRMDKGNDRSVKQELPSGLQGIGPSLNIPNMKPMRPDQPPPMRDPAIISSRLDSGLSELERLAAQRNILSGSLGGLGGSNGQSSNMSGIPGLSKPVNNFFNNSPLGLGMGQSQSGIPNSLGGGHGLGSLDSDLTRLGAALSASAGNRLNLGNALEERSRLLSNSSIPGLGITDRERIEMDIARVDSRIRDLDRSLAAVEGRNDRVPPSPVTVFVRNLPFSLSWQKLRDRFSRIGNVLFCEIKTENGKSKGYGFVRFESLEQAQMAVRHFDGIEMEGRRIQVKLDDDKYGNRR